LPLFSLVEEWVCENRLATTTTTTAASDSHVSISIINDNNSNICNNNSNSNTSNRSNTSAAEMDTKWLYDYSFCLAIESENVAALERLLAMADESNLLSKPPQDNNEALIRVNKYSNLVV
jgi:hypothetical protein